MMHIKEAIFEKIYLRYGKPEVWNKLQSSLLELVCVLEDLKPLMDDPLVPNEREYHLKKFIKKMAKAELSMNMVQYGDPNLKKEIYRFKTIFLSKMNHTLKLQEMKERGENIEKTN